MNFPAEVITKRVVIMMGSLIEGTRLKDLLAVMNWVVSELMARTQASTEQARERGVETRSFACLVADAMEALGQHVQQEAPDELVRLEPHRLPAVAPALKEMR